MSSRPGIVSDRSRHTLAVVTGLAYSDVSVTGGTSTTDGFIKILADAATDRILGVHMITPAASEMIAEAAVIMEFGGSAEDLARTCHAHPSLTEAVKEAALAVDKRPIHM